MVRLMIYIKSEFTAGTLQFESIYIQIKMTNYAFANNVVNFKICLN